MNSIDFGVFIFSYSLVGGVFGFLLFGNFGVRFYFVSLFEGCFIGFLLDFLRI